MKKTLIALLFLFPTYLFSIDDIEAPYKLNFNLVSGNIQSFGTKRLENIIGDPVSGFELGLSINSSLFENAKWPYWHNYPNLSLNFLNMNLGNDSILGNMMAIYPQLEYSFKTWKKINLSLLSGTGLAYYNKTFDNALVYKTDGTIDFDHSNSAIGSHVNIMFTFGLNAAYKFSKTISLSAGLKSYHASNGNAFQPNGGLNIYTANIGLIYTPNQTIITQRKYCCVPDMDRKPIYELIIGGGSRELYYKTNKRFAIGSFSLARFKPLNNYLRLGVGADLFYDAAYSFVNIDDAVNYRKTYIVSDKFSNRFRFGVSIQPEIIYDRFIVGFHTGVYLINPIKNLEPFKEAQRGDFTSKPKGLFYLYNINQEDGWLYSRLSIKYKITPKIFAFSAIKTHLTNAEFLEFGLGYTIH